MFVNLFVVNTSFCVLQIPVFLTFSMKN